MSEAFRDGFGVYTLLEHQAGVRVPEIVKPDSRKSYLARLTPKSLAEGVWAQRGTVNHMAEHQGLIGQRDSQRGRVTRFGLPVGSKH